MSTVKVQNSVANGAACHYEKEQNHLFLILRRLTKIAAPRTINHKAANKNSSATYHQS
jgi:hypothetical protein